MLKLTLVVKECILPPKLFQRDHCLERLSVTTFFSNLVYDLLVNSVEQALRKDLALESTFFEGSNGAVLAETGTAVMAGAFLTTKGLSSSLPAGEETFTAHEAEEWKGRKSPMMSATFYSTTLTPPASVGSGTELDETTSR